LEPSIKTVRCRLQALTLEQRIRTRADELWREDGSLEGCADEYWRLARRLIELEVANESAVNETPTLFNAALVEDTADVAASAFQQHATGSCCSDGRYR
jgi:hypothetical protein